MNQKEFLEMPYLERVEYINGLLLRFGDNEPLKKTAAAVNMSYSSFCKAMREGGFTYSQGKRQYEKTLSIEEYRSIQASIKSDQGVNKGLNFLSDHLEELRNLLETHKNSFVLDPEVYNPNSPNVTKSIVVNQMVYDRFVDLCSLRFPQYRISHVISHCLNKFVKENQEAPSKF
jgi:hypothetical protein